MKNHFITSIVCIGLSLACVTTVHSQTAFVDCIGGPRSLCVNDPGVALPDSNQLLVGEDAPGATSCGVHVTQSRTISSNCIGSIDYYVALIIGDSMQEILQPLTTVYVDFSNQAELTYDTRTAASAAIRKHGLSYNQGCNDVHTIRWVVMDNCGNEVVCEERVHLYDCQPPNVLLHEQPVIIRISAGCSISATARDMIADVIDDCISPESFLYSFDAGDYKPDTFFYCDLVPAIGVELPAEIWIADNGIDANCNGEIEWSERSIQYQPVSIVFTDNSGSCHCDPVFEEIVIRGHISTPDNRPIEKVNVTMASPGHVYPTYVTSVDGEYIFNNVWMGNVVTITAERNDNHRNGVSTIDVIKLQKHLLGIEPITNPYTLIAMDANNSHNVSVIDIVELGKLILGVYSELPWNTSWRFLDKKYQFSDPSDPWADPKSITFTVTDDVEDADFIGIKTGDVNGSVKPVNHTSPFEPAYPVITFTTAQQYYNRGDIIEIPVRMVDDELVMGFQFTISDPNLEFMEIDPVGLLANHPFYFRSFIDTHSPGGKHHLTALWFDTVGVAFDPDKVLFVIKARAAYSGNLAQSLSMNSSRTEAEAYDNDEKLYKPVLHVVPAGRQLFLSTATPNPWNDETRISFYLPTASRVRMMISDQSSAVVYAKEIEGHEGRNEVILHASEINGAGFLFIALQSDDGIVFQKMLLVK